MPRNRDKNRSRRHCGKLLILIIISLIHATNQLQVFSCRGRLPLHDFSLIKFNSLTLQFNYLTSYLLTIIKSSRVPETNTRVAGIDLSICESTAKTRLNLMV